MDQKYFFNVLLKRKWLILGTTITVTLLTFLITKQLDEVYISRAQLATGITDQQVVSLEDDSKRYVNSFTIENKFNNLVEIITSRPVISLLSYDLVLHDLNSNDPFRVLDDTEGYYAAKAASKPDGPYQANLSGTISVSDYSIDIMEAQRLFKTKLETQETLNFTDKREKALSDLLKNLGYDQDALMEKLKVGRKPGTDFITIEFESEDPYLSSFVVNTLCQEFLRYYKNVKGENSNNSVEFFSKLASQTKAELDAKVEALKNFKLRHNVFNLEEQTRSIVSQIRELEMARESENKKIPALKQSMDKIERKLTGEEKSFYDSKAILINEKIVDLKAKINESNSRYVATGKRDQKVQESLNALRAELASEISAASAEGIVNPGQHRQDMILRRLNDELELEAAKASVQSIDRELARLSGKVSGFASNEASIAALEREIAVASEEYLNVLNKLNTARLSSLNLGGNIRQIEFGQPADSPESSKSLIFVALAFIVSFSMCVVSIFFVEYIDPAVKTPANFSKSAGLVLMGPVNAIDFRFFDLDAIFKNPANDPANETFKHLIRKLRFDIETSSGKVFLFTSTKLDAGKTFLISSLAYSLCMTNKRVLIIDTNLKNNSLTDQFRAKPTLEKYLHKEIGVKDLVSRTEIIGIDVIGCKGGNFTPSEAFSLARLEEMISEMSLSYDYVFLEGASLNKYSDSKELAGLVHKIIPVFAADSDINPSDKQSISYLKQHQGKLMGSILNKVGTDNLDQ